MGSNQVLSKTALLCCVQKVLSKSRHPGAGDAQQRCSSDELVALCSSAARVQRCKKTDMAAKADLLSTQLTSLSYTLDQSLSFTATAHLELRTPSHNGSTVLAQKLLSLITLSARIIPLLELNISIYLYPFTCGILLCQILCSTIRYLFHM